MLHFFKKSNNLNNKDFTIMNSRIKELRDLTEKLPSLSDLLKNGTTEANPVRYEMKEGIGWGYPLFRSAELAVQRVFMPKGATFLPHTHFVKEWVFTTTGCYKLKDCPQEGKEFSSGMLAIFEPNEPHGGVMLENTWILSLTIPADMEGYPNAG